MKKLSQKKLFIQKTKISNLNSLGSLKHNGKCSAVADVTNATKDSENCYI